MTTLIERLRTEKLRGIYTHIDKQREEAAYEIEHLRTENKCLLVLAKEWANIALALQTQLEVP